jgi:hypothetical protein
LQEEASFGSLLKTVMKSEEIRVRGT